MRENEVARHRAGTQWPGMGRVSCSSVATVALAVMLLGCGDATCPGGSNSVDGQCVPTVQCGDGLERVGNVCMRESGAVKGDGAIDDPIDDARSSAGSGGEAGAPSDAGRVERTDAAVQDAADPTAAPDAGRDAEPQPEPCADYACGDHGRCEAAGGDPHCTCDSGFVGERCESCEPGLGLAGDECVPVCESDDAPDCGAHGTCEVAGTIAQCVCQHPAVGTLCDGCAKGFALQADGSCAPACRDCGAHGYCDGTLMVPDCACYAGYEAKGQACVWVGDGRTGGIVDGNLDNSAAWQTEHATVAGGSATFASSGVGAACELGWLSQTFTMPEREQAEPLVLEIDATTSCTKSNPEACPPLLVEFGNSVTRLRVPSGANPRTHAMCLGEAGYGGEVVLRIRPGLAAAPLGAEDTWFGCEGRGPDFWPRVNAVRIRSATAGECPQPGQIPGGDFSSSEPWQLGMTSRVANGALTLTDSARVSFLAPSAATMPTPALIIVPDGAGPSQNHFIVELDGLSFATVFGPETAPRFLCLPSWSQGVVHELTLRALEGTRVITEVSVASKPACGDAAFDQGFVRSLSTGAWDRLPSFSPSAEAVVDDRSPIRGPTSLRVTTGANLRALVRVPDVPGVAFTFMARVGETTPGGAVYFSRMPPEGTIEIAPGQSQAELRAICLGQAWKGQLAQPTLLLTAQDVSDTEQGILWLDEASIGVNSGCE